MVLGKQPDIRNPVPQHRNPLHAKTKGKSLDFGWIITYCLKYFGVDGTGTENFKPDGFSFFFVFSFDWPLGNNVGMAGETMRGSLSSSSKIRSAAAIACCRMVYFSDRSRIGMKKRCVYWMNATNTPNVVTP